MHRPAPALARFLRGSALALGLAAPSFATMIPIVWLGGSGNWSSATNWVGGIAPINTTALQYGATIASGNAIVDANISIEALTFSGGLISGGFALTLTGPTGSTWTAGNMAGGGTTRVASGAALTISGADKTLYHGGQGSGGRILENYGTVTWAAGAGSLLLGDGASIVNRAGGSFLIQNDSGIAFAGFGSAGSITNEGTVTKSVAMGTSNITQSFANTGLIDTQTGAIDFKSGLTNSGELRAASGAANLFSGSQTFNSGTSFTGSGANRITGGGTVFNGTISSQNLELAGGTLDGTATWNGTVAWTGGDLVGGGTFTLGTGTLTLSGNADKNLYHGGQGSGGRTLDNASSIVWTGAGNLTLGDGAKISNRSGATFNAQNNAAIAFNGRGNAGSFTNAGTFLKSGSGGTTTLTQTTFTNTGVVDAQSGTIAFTSVLTSTGGTFRSASGAANTFTGTQNFTDTSFTGLGANLISRGGTVLSGTITSENLEFAGGTMDGTAIWNGTLAWTGGDLVGGGSFTIGSGTLTLSGAADKNLYHGGQGNGGRTLANASSILWTGAGNITLGDGAQIVNRTGATFTAQNDAAIVFNGRGSAGSFTNAGTFLKSGGVGSTTIGQSFASTGLVRAQSGTIAFTGGVTSTSGEFRADAGASITFAGGQSFTDASFTGSGINRLLGGGTGFTHSISSANLELAGGTADGTATLNGQILWTATDLVGGGIFTISSGSTLTLSGAASKNLYHGGQGNGGRTLENFGRITWTGTGDLTLGDGAQIINRTGATFDIQNNRGLGHNGRGSPGSFTNAGTLLKSAGDGTTTIGQSLANTGLIDVRSGVLLFTAPLTSSGGELHAETNTVIEFTGGQSFGDGTQFTGAGINRVSASGTAFNGAISSVNLQLAGGDAYGNATFSGTIGWTLTNLVGAGTFTVASNGTLTLSGESDKNLFHGGQGSGGRILENLGSIMWTGAGNVLLGDGAAITNRSGGTFVAQNDAAISFNGRGSLGSFTNAGTFLKSGTNGTTTIAQSSFANTGLVHAQSGTIAFTSSLAGTGGEFRAATGAANIFSGSQSFSGVSFTGSGANRITGGGTVFSGAISSTNLELAGGTMDGTATFNGNVTWTQADFVGGGVFTIGSGTLTLAGTADKNLYHGGQGNGGRTLDNASSIVWTGTGNLTLGDGAQISNRAGATFTAQNDAAIVFNGRGSAGSFTNTGTFLKSGTNGITSVAQPFTNTGLVHAQSGTIAFASSLAGTGGEFRAATGSANTFASAQTFTGASFTGTGTNRITGGATVFSGAISSTNLELAGGTMDGTATFNGNVTWTQADFVGGGIFMIGSGTLTLAGTGDKNLYHGGQGNGGRTLDNASSIVWTGAGNLTLGDAAQISNRAGATFTAQNDAAIVFNGRGSVGSFTNAGTFLKSGTNGITTIAQSFTNSGLVQAQSGTISFTSGVTSNGGTFTAAAGAAIQFNANAGRSFGPGTSFLGAGTNLITDGTSFFDGTLTAQNLVFAGGVLTGSNALNGALTWTGGSWVGGGTFTVNRGSTLTLDGANNKDLYHGGQGSGGHVLSNSGTVRLQGSGGLLLGDGAQIANNSGGLFEIRSDTSIAFDGRGSSGSFVNNGIVSKTAGTGTATIAQPFTQNAGALLAATSGTLAFTSSFANNNGSIALANNATLALPGALSTGSGSISGAGTLSASSVSAGGVVAPGNDTGRLTFTGNLSLLSTSALLIDLGGTVQGTSYDFVSVGGSATLGGALAVRFFNGFQSSIQTTDTFTVLTAGSTGGLGGAFSNVANGQRIFTSDGFGSFQVNYGVSSSFAANSVVLSNFIPVPEPSTYLLIGLGGALLAGCGRRKNWRRR